MLEVPQMAMPAGHFHPRVGDEMIPSRVFPLLCLISDILSALYQVLRLSAAMLVPIRLFLTVAAGDREHSLLLLVLEEPLTPYPVFPHPVRHMLRLRSRIAASLLAVLPIVKVFAMLLHSPDSGAYVFARLPFFLTVAHQRIGYDGESWDGLVVSGWVYDVFGSVCDIWQTRRSLRDRFPTCRHYLGVMVFHMALDLCRNDRILTRLTPDYPIMR